MSDESKNQRCELCASSCCCCRSCVFVLGCDLIDSVFPSRQDIIREKRGVESVFALLDTLRRVLAADHPPIVTYFGLKVVSLCLKTLFLMISRCERSCIVASLHLPLLMNIVQGNFVIGAEEHYVKNTLELSKLASATVLVSALQMA